MVLNSFLTALLSSSFVRSRRLPTPIDFYASDPLHRTFVTQTTAVLQRVYRAKAPATPAGSRDGLSSLKISAGEKIMSLVREDSALLSSVDFHPEEFEKVKDCRESKDLQMPLSLCVSYVSNAG